VIPVSVVQVPDEAHALVAEVLASGRLAQGPMVERLESLMAEAHGVAHAVAVCNGTVSLVDALEALDVGPGDEVVTSPFTFVATLNAILETGATATFADIDLDGYGLDPAAAVARVTDATKAIMPVHLYGQPADVPGLVEALGDRTLPMVEDAAQAHGAAIGARPVGSWGVGSFSFYATKNVTTGEGGMITTDDDEVAERLRLLRNQGMKARYQYVVAGHNHRMTELAAAVGIPQMERLTDINAARSANAAALGERLAGIEGLVLPAQRPGTTHVWHQYTVRVTPDARVDRDALGAGLADRGVASGIYYPALVFDYDCYRSNPRVQPAEVPNAAAAAGQVLSLPVHPGLSTADVDTIATAVREVMSR
jgi:dTDP-4-amino-4,6-dideoxygalactose transaminase